MTLFVQNDGTVAADANGFCAGGTCFRHADVARPSRVRRWQLIGELICIFVALPIVTSLASARYGWPLFYVLPPVIAVLVLYLRKDTSFSMLREFSQHMSWPNVRNVLAVFAVGSVVMAGAVWLFMPDQFMSLVVRRPEKWLKVLVLYPLTSVLIQEFVYRVIFFHRYGPLFGNRSQLIVVNAAVFAIGHVMFRNWVAIAGTFVLGLLLAWRYERTNSFWVVWLEHVLWGYLVFTVGLHTFFLSGMTVAHW